MFKILFSLPILLFSLNLVGQTDQYVVDLVVPKQLNKLGFEIAEVLDRRINESNIGFAQIGIIKRRVPAVLPDTFDTYLTKTLNELVVSKGEKITLIFHEFYAVEYSKTNATYAKFRLQVEFAKSIDGQLYSVGYAEQEIAGRGEFVEKRYGKLLMKGLIACLLEFSKSSWQEEQGELIDDTLDFEYDYTKIPKRGLYSSFARMARNEPFMETDFVIKGTDGERGIRYHKYYVEDNRTRRLRKRIFGFSYGNKIYIHVSMYYYGNYFVRAKLVGKYIYFEDRYSDPLASYAFGLVGHIATNKPKGIVLDTATGFVTILIDSEMNFLLNQYPEVKDTYMQSKQKLADKREAIEAINELYKK